MAIANDNAGVSTDNTAGGTTLDLSVAVGSISNGLLVVDAVVLSGSARTITSIVWNGHTLIENTDCTETWSADGTQWRIAKYYWKNPENFTGNAHIITSGNGYIALGATSWSGVDQTTTFRTGAKTTGTLTAAALTVTSSVGDVVLAHISSAGTAAGTSSGNTQRWEQEETIQEGSVANGASADGTAVTTAMTWTVNNATITWGACGVAMIPAAAGGFNPGWAYGATKTIGGVF